MTSHSSKLRILCLHGWMQNSEIMKRNMDVMIRRFDGPIEFVFLTGPQELPTALRPGRPTITPLASWVLPKVDDNGNLVEMERFDEAVQFIIDFIQKNGPFDGILGFSQGAAVSAVLMFILSHDDWRKKYNVPRDIPQFRLAVLLAGFRIATPNYTEFFTRGKLTTPTMHVSSHEDTIISLERTQELIDDHFADAALSIHNLGHRIVATPQLMKDYERFFHRFVYIQPTTSL